MGQLQGHVGAQSQEMQLPQLRDAGGDGREKVLVEVQRCEVGQSPHHVGGQGGQLHVCQAQLRQVVEVSQSGLGQQDRQLLLQVPGWGSVTRPQKPGASEVLRNSKGKVSSLYI